MHNAYSMVKLREIREKSKELGLLFSGFECAGNCSIETVVGPGAKVSEVSGCAIALFTWEL